MKDLLLSVHVVVKTLNKFFWNFHVVWQTASKNSTSLRATHAARLYFLVYPIRSLFSGVVIAVAVAVVLA